MVCRLDGLKVPAQVVGWRSGTQNFGLDRGNIFRMQVSKNNSNRTKIVLFDEFIDHGNTQLSYAIVYNS